MAQIHKDFARYIQESLQVQPKEIINITKTLGRVIAEDVVAIYNSPRKNISAVDGYAIISKNIETTPVTLTKVGESLASRPFKGQICNNQTVKVYYGSTVPMGADTIIALENTEENGDQIIVTGEIMAEQNICYAGIDFVKGEAVLKRNRVITARDIGLAAAMGVSWIPVVRQPLVGVLSVGDELSMLGDVHDSSHTISSSSLVVSAFISACGGIPVNLGIIPDSAEAIETILATTQRLDLLVTTGGVSAAADNLMHKALEKKYSQLKEVSIALNQTENVLFASKDDSTPVLALPGNPISTKICAVLFLKPAIERMLDTRSTFYKKSFAILDRNLDINDRKMDYIFSRLTEGKDKQLLALPASSYDRLLLSALADSDCLIAVDRNNSKSGCEVEITRFTCAFVSG